MAQAIATQAQTVTAQTTREGAHREKPHACTIASKLRDFFRINPSVYYRSKTNEDSQEFVDDVNKILFAMDVNEEEKVELDAYQLNDVAQVWHMIWRDGLAPGEVPITWDVLKTAFLEWLFPRE